MFISSFIFNKVCKYIPKQPIYFINKLSKWKICLHVNVLPPEYPDYPDDDMYEQYLISVGLCHSNPNSQLLGSDNNSIGYHSDDGLFYQESLIIGKGEKYGSCDKITLIIDYENGQVEFEKNKKNMLTHTLRGEFLSNSLYLGITTSTNNFILLHVDT
jgi:hypothetical protein